MPDALPADDPHRRPDGVDDATVAAVGKMTEALECVERVRGHLFSFHQLTGTADFAFGEAADMLEKAGHADLADAIRRDVVGRNLIPGYWSFQLVEAYDDGYYAAVRAAEQKTREALLGGRRHVFESEMKEQRRTHGRPGH